MTERECYWSQGAPRPVAAGKGTLAVRRMSDALCDVAAASGRGLALRVGGTGTGHPMRTNYP